MSSSLFRNRALERLTSPEQLDRVMHVTNTRAWIALVATAAVILSVVIWGFWGVVPVSVQAEGILLRPGGLRPVIALSSGQVVEVLVREGDTIPPGSVVARLVTPAAEDEKQEFDVVSQFGGQVSVINIKIGDFLSPGDNLLELSLAGENLECLLFPSLGIGKKVKPGMVVQVSPTSIDRTKYGYILGRVTSVSKYSLSETQLRETLGDENLTQVFLKGSSAAASAPLRVRIELRTDLSSASGLKWSSRTGPPYPVSPGTLCVAQIVTEWKHPANLIIPDLERIFNSSWEGES